MTNFKTVALITTMLACSSLACGSQNTPTKQPAAPEPAATAPAEPRSHKFTTEGAEVHYRELGDGPPLLLINGFAASGDAWASDFLDALAESHRVLVLDNRGTGLSTADGSFSMTDLANDAAAVLDHAGAGPAVVVGFSMGGMIAQELAILHPDKLSKLVLVSTGSGGAEMKLNQALFAPLFPPDNADPADAAVREFWASIAAPGFDERDSSVVDGIAASHRRQPTSRNVLNFQAGAIGQFDRSKDLGQVRVPTVIVHGTADPLNPLSNAEQLSAGIPGATLIPVDGGGHLLPWEQPERLLEILAGS